MKNNPHLNILVQMAKVDGFADESELELIRQIGSSSMISAEDVEEAIQKADMSDSVMSISGFSRSEKLELMYNLVRVMKADGIIHEEEAKFCKAVAHKLGFAENSIDELVNIFEGNDHSDKDQFMTKISGYLS